VVILNDLLLNIFNSKENGIKLTEPPMKDIISVLSGMGNIVYHGPILLAFSVIFAYWNSNTNTEVSSFKVTQLNYCKIEWRSFANKSIKLAPIQFLCKLFTDNLLADDVSGSIETLLIIAA
jgi:hypothetical protein